MINTYKLKGTLSRPAGGALVGAVIALTAQATGLDVLESTSYKFVTDSHGKYDLDLIFGQYSVAAIVGTRVIDIGKFSVSRDTPEGLDLTFLLSVGSTPPDPDWVITISGWLDDARRSADLAGEAACAADAASIKAAHSADLAERDAKVALGSAEEALYAANRAAESAAKTDGVAEDIAAKIEEVTETTDALSRDISSLVENQVEVIDSIESDSIKAAASANTARILASMIQQLYSVGVDIVAVQNAAERLALDKVDTFRIVLQVDNGNTYYLKPNGVPSNPDDWLFSESCRLNPVVQSFNERTGPVRPEKGDYTAGMVGALPSAGGKLSGKLDINAVGGGTSVPLSLNRGAQVGIGFGYSTDSHAYLGVDPLGRLSFGNDIDHTINARVFHTEFLPSLQMLGALAGEVVNTPNLYNHNPKNGVRVGWVNGTVTNATPFKGLVGHVVTVSAVDNHATQMFAGKNIDTGKSVLAFRDQFGRSGEFIETYHQANKPTLADIGAAPAGFGLGESEEILKDGHATPDANMFISAGGLNAVNFVDSYAPVLQLFMAGGSDGTGSKAHIQVGLNGRLSYKIRSAGKWSPATYALTSADVVDKFPSYAADSPMSARLGWEMQEQITGLQNFINAQGDIDIDTLTTFSHSVIAIGHTLPKFANPFGVDILNRNVLLRVESTASRNLIMQSMQLAIDSDVSAKNRRQNGVVYKRHGRKKDNTYIWGSFYLADKPVSRFGDTSLLHMHYKWKPFLPMLSEVTGVLNVDTNSVHQAEVSAQTGELVNILNYKKRDTPSGLELRAFDSNVPAIMTFPTHINAFARDARAFELVVRYSTDSSGAHPAAKVRFMLQTKIDTEHLNLVTVEDALLGTHKDYQRGLSASIQTSTMESKDIWGSQYEKTKRGSVAEFDRALTTIRITYDPAAAIITIEASIDVPTGMPFMEDLGENTPKFYAIEEVPVDFSLMDPRLTFVPTLELSSIPSINGGRTGSLLVNELMHNVL